MTTRRINNYEEDFGYGDEYYEEEDEEEKQIRLAKEKSKKEAEAKKKLQKSKSLSAGLIFSFQSKHKMLKSRPSKMPQEKTNSRETKFFLTQQIIRMRKILALQLLSNSKSKLSKWKTKEKSTRK